MGKAERRAKKKAARYRKGLRRDLVHAAGCTHRRCVTVLGALENVGEAEAIGVRVPRSLHRYYWRHLDRSRALELFLASTLWQ